MEDQREYIIGPFGKHPIGHPSAARNLLCDKYGMPFSTVSCCTIDSPFIKFYGEILGTYCWTDGEFSFTFHQMSAKI